MVSLYMLKEQVVKGIYASAPVAQAAEIADFIGAQSFIVDLVLNSAKFSGILGRADVEVKSGDVVSIMGGSISVMAKAAFYGMFEDYVEPETPPAQPEE